MRLTVVIRVIIGAALLACSVETPGRSPETSATSQEQSRSVDRSINPYLVAEESTVKITISTAEDEYISSGVIVGDGHFVVTYACLLYTSPSPRD